MVTCFFDDDQSLGGESQGVGYAEVGEPRLCQGYAEVGEGEKRVNLHPQPNPNPKPPPNPHPALHRNSRRVVTLKQQRAVSKTSPPP